MPDRFIELRDAIVARLERCGFADIRLSARPYTIPGQWTTLRVDLACKTRDGYLVRTWRLFDKLVALRWEDDVEGTVSMIISRLIGDAEEQAHSDPYHETSLAAAEEAASVNGPGMTEGGR